MEIHPPFLGLSPQSVLEQPVHRVRKPDLIDPIFDKVLKKIAFKPNIMNAVPLRLQPLLISLHGGPVEHQFLLVELEGGLNP